MCWCTFIEHTWEERDPKSWALNAISATAHFMPGIRGKTPGSSRLMKAWSKTELPERAPPLPTLFATALAGAALRRHDLRLCVLILVAFHALLRSGEMCRVQASHFVRPSRTGLVLLTLPGTKSGIRRGDYAESVVLTDPFLIQYLHVLLPRILHGERLWPKDSQSFRMQFRQLCTDARLPTLPWRPYSIRRGGETQRIFFSLALWTRQRFEGVAAFASIVTTPAQESHIRSLAEMVASAKILSW